MANRDLSTFRRVTDVVAKDASMTAAGVAGVLNNAMDEQQQAQVAKNVSQAQLELNQLDYEYRTKNQSNPFDPEAQREYQERRKDVLGNASGGIAPHFMGEWDNATRQLEARSDSANQAWGFEQSRKNTVTSINESITNAFTLAENNGRMYGRGENTDIGALLDYTPNRQQLQNYANKHLGEEDSKALLGTYDEDYIKSFVSGVAQDNPAAAYSMLEDPRVKGVLENSPGYGEFRTAIQNKALNFQKTAVQMEALDVLSRSGTMVSEALANRTPLTYKQIEEMTADASPATRDFLLKQSGYKTPGERKMTQGEKLTEKAGLINEIFNMINADEITDNEIGLVQDRIIKSVDNGVLSREEGAKHINSLLSPLITSKQDRVSKFQEGEWNPFRDNTGFSQIEEYFGDRVEIRGTNEAGELDADIELSAEAQAVNNTNKVNLYDYFFDAVSREAANYSSPQHPNGVSVTDLYNEDVIPSQIERSEILDRAARTAINTFNAQSQPLKIRNTIPEAAIKMILNNPTPEMAQQFDAKYGTGASARILFNGN